MWSWCGFIYFPFFFFFELWRTLCISGFKSFKIICRKYLATAFEMVFLSWLLSPLNSKYMHVRSLDIAHRSQMLFFFNVFFFLFYLKSFHCYVLNFTNTMYLFFHFWCYIYISTIWFGSLLYLQFLSSSGLYFPLLF